MSEPRVVTPPVRLVMRLLLEFTIASLPHLARWHGGDLVRGIAFLAIAQANRPRFSDLARRGALSWSGGDAGLKPVSVNSLAASLGLPYETARRQVQRLIREGLVVRSNARGARDAQGVYVPNAVVAGSGFEAFAGHSYAAFLRLMRGLRAIGFDFDSLGKGAAASDPAANDPACDAEPADLAVRHVVIDFMLRLVECGLVVHDNDIMRGLLFAGIMSANAAPYTNDADAAWSYATLQQSPPEAARRPITVLQLSHNTGIPYETARRYVARMLADKDIVRVRGKGLINPRQSPRDAALHQSGAQVMSRFVQFVGDLRRLRFSFETLEVVPAKVKAA